MRLADRRRRLRLALGAFFVALALPAALLVAKAWSQLRWEAFHVYQQQAVDLAARIDRRFEELIRAEEARAAGDYGFLVVSGDPSANFLQLSPLSAWPPASALPGSIGYFQVDPDGVLSTPLLPEGDATVAERYGIGAPELQQRRALAARIEQILGQNRLLARRDAQPREKATDELATSADRPAPASEPLVAAGERAVYAAKSTPAPQSFDAAAAEQDKQSYLGRVEELKLERQFADKESLKKDQGELRQEAQNNIAPRSARKQREALAEAVPEQAMNAPALPASPPPSAAGSASAALEQQPVRVRMFDTEIEPFSMRLLESGHFVLYRHVLRDGRRFAQGVLIERDALLSAVIGEAERESLLAGVADLAIAWQGEVLSLVPASAPSRLALNSAAELQGALLYRSRLAAPLDSLELVFSLQRLPAGPGASVVIWLAAVLALVLCGGMLLLYRLALGQVLLAEQQQDFVAAVSHELKTPLTSIRMYGEMLREGWAAEERKQSYYAFIHDEAERLSRLIANVLQLARISRNETVLQPELLSCQELLERARPKLASPVERAGFALELRCEPAAESARLRLDPDAFCQVLINLVDNALKFAARAEPRRIEIACRLSGSNEVLFAVRDFGPGIPDAQMKKIFRLFYRIGNELTRETAGTGIGLALVKQLVEAMGGSVDVVNCKPGAEFRLRFTPP